ncbi:hypothetical protein OIU79_006435 [Salix purpurea]|uniref:Uncharacterized protein n=1 Tax=Salix purpurea TaxID=77065 RepID=A0A9Q0TVI7_SALPP|nr:hypothetical protein OIU79_006435 [Salix purpurea]
MPISIAASTFLNLESVRCCRSTKHPQISMHCKECAQMHVRVYTCRRTVVLETHPKPTKHNVHHKSSVTHLICITVRDHKQNSNFCLCYTEKLFTNNRRILAFTGISHGDVIW